MEKRKTKFIVTNHYTGRKHFFDCYKLYLKHKLELEKESVDNGEKRGIIDSTTTLPGKE